MNKYPDRESVTLTIERFRTFLNSSWPTLVEIFNGHDWDDDAYFLEDWLDANWGLLVCRQLLGKNVGLQPFAVAVNDLNKGNYTYHLESIGDRKTFIALGSGDEVFKLAPPFDKVRVITQSGAIEILPLSSLQFELRATSKES